MGFLVVDNNKITRQFGGAEGPDPMRKFDDIVKHLNEHGGLEGRRILAERFVIDGSQSDAPTWAQRACSFFAEDKRVAVVLSVEWTHPVLEGCLSAARIPHFDAGIAYNLDGLAQQEYLYSNITTIGRDRYEAVRLRAAADRGWVKRGDKVGVLIADCDPYNRVYDKIVAPAAASLGVQLLPQRSKCNEGIGDLGSGIAAGRSAVLRFRTEGVTTVMAVSPAESAIWTFFAQEAENQNFRPFYLVTSDALPHMLATHSGSFAMPETHREKLRGFGWKAIVDTGPTSAPATPVQRDARSACMRMSTDAGGAISANGVDASQLSWYFDVCDSVLFLGKLLAATGGDTRMQALVAAYDAVATAFDPANAPAGRFDPPAGRRDGIASVTSFAYDRRCRCMKYAGMPIAVP